MKIFLFPPFKCIFTLEMYLDIPVLVQIVDARDAASVAVWVVNMADVTCPVAWVTGNHGLKTRRNGIVS